MAFLHNSSTQKPSPIVLPIIALLGGITLSWLSWYKGCFLLVCIGWICTLCGVSGCNFSLIHKTDNDCLTSHPAFDKWFYRVIAVLICVQEVDQHTKDLINPPKAKTQRTIKGYIAKLLASIGIQLGLKSGSYRHPLSQLSNPLFLVQFFFRKRLLSVLFQKHRSSRRLAWGIWGLILVLIKLSHCEIPFLIAYAIPVILHSLGNR